MSSKCNHPKDKLIRRGASQHPGEYLFTCGTCGEKLQGRKKFGFMKYYQVKSPSSGEIKSHIATARYPDSLVGIVSKHGGQKIFDAGIAKIQEREHE